MTIVTMFLDGQHWFAFSVEVEGSDVYINYTPDGNGPHTSYHASGQHHQRKSKGKGNYVLWTGGNPGESYPLKQFKQEPSTIQGRESASPIGWTKSQIRLRPIVAMAGDLSVDASSFPESSALVFEISVVGPNANERGEIEGCPVLHRHRIRGDVEVEIEAFLVRDSDPLSEPFPRLS